MNDTLDISQRFMEFFYAPANLTKSKILVVSKYNERTRVNIMLLKYFLQDMNKRGIFITIDRPHQYTSSLLSIHGISEEKLIFIDAISRISGETESNVSNVEFINGPYGNNFLDEISSISCASGNFKTRTINLEDIDFILIDDIAAIAKYQEEDGIRAMIDSYISSIEGIKNVIAPIVLDVNQNQFIYETIVRRCDRVLLINLSKSLFKDITTDELQSVNAMSPNKAITSVCNPTATGG